MTAAAPPSSSSPPADDDGYRLWLRYERLADGPAGGAARAAFRVVALPPRSATLAAARDELLRGLGGLLRAAVATHDRAAAGGAPFAAGTFIAGTPASAPVIARLGMQEALAALGPEGYLFRRVERTTLVLASAGDAGILYGVFQLLRHLQTGRSLDALDGASSAPRLALRMLDHWDNLDGTIERGYAGSSLWDWHKLPDYVAPRYRDYARACASVGINAASLTNVNADPRVLTAEYLPKVAALADVLRPWGLRVFLTARCSAPIEIGGLPTADPLDAAVAAWWRDKAAEIYRHIPDFGGLLVKASSEGQPGPQDYGRGHADGANVLADALAPHGGTVVWRAFVYRADVAEDRAKQAYLELTPEDGRFRPNVVLQVKNGPIDFQPREPFHPLFGAMPRTPLALEVMITQEYLGFATHLVYLAPLFKETLDADTHAAGAGSTVARVIEGALPRPGGARPGGIAGVANVGSDRNWCGHPFAQANWYAFGRLAWDSRLTAGEIADEWLRMTFTDDDRFVGPVKGMMLASREAPVDYMTPLGLHHLMAEGHHYGPGPWVDAAATGRADWSATYYHRADADGIGFDRTATGSNAVALYREPVAGAFADPRVCPEPLLLWFHHLPWDHRLRSGRTLWDELCHRYSAGVDAVRAMRRTWDAAAPFIDAARAEHVRALLAIQEKEARWWRDACLLYFQTFAQRPVPPELPPLDGTLAELRLRRPSHVPGI